MSNVSFISSENFLQKLSGTLISAINSSVFLFLDLLDYLLCIFYRLLDEFFEGDPSPCYCEQKRGSFSSCDDDELSESLYGRENVFRGKPFPPRAGRKWEEDCKEVRDGKKREIRWSDCGCESCGSWMNSVDQRLHVVVREPSKANNTEDYNVMPKQNIIFLHGFLASSSFWTETVFLNLSESAKCNYRLFAVDLLGFGRSPKPNNCMYTLRDHVERIENSVVGPFQLNSFHLVAHSMGCIIALALAAKYPNAVKSITLIAPPYFPYEEDASLKALGILARKSLWPPLLFGSSVMSWYEHLGRCVCFLVCRHHRAWEWILKLLTRRRDLHFMIIDLTRHTHRSAWHTMHNVICGGAKVSDKNLEILSKSGVKISIIQGAQDQVVPLECSKNIKTKAPNVMVSIIKNADHSSVILVAYDRFVYLSEVE
ncbi:hypothetical protein LguiB_004033 [Lonicera macranthoides]